MNLEIKKANPIDLKAIIEIGKETFTETFAQFNSAQDMKNYLLDNFNGQKMQKELLNVNSLFFLALFNDLPVGYLKLNFNEAQTELKLKESLEIERIYVLKKFQGKKIGQALFQKALFIGNQKSLDFIWLGVWEKNEKALAFYDKAGFKRFDKHIFKLGNDEQTDILMKMKLSENTK